MSLIGLDTLENANSLENAYQNPVTPDSLRGGVGQAIGETLKAPFTGLRASLDGASMLLADSATPFAKAIIARPLDTAFGGHSVEDWFNEQQRITHQAIRESQPDPMTANHVSEAVHGLFEVVPQFVVGSLAGGPAGGAALAGGIQANKGMVLAKEQAGVDDLTAVGMGLIQGGATAVGGYLPMHLAPTITAGLGSGSKYAVNALFGASVQVPTGMVTRGATSSLLEARGYKDMADQYKVFDKGAILADAIMGGAFGVVGHGMDALAQRKASERILPSDVDMALTQNELHHKELDTTPGLPTNEEARQAHVDAVDTALKQMMAGEPVDVGDTVTHVVFEENPHQVEARTEIGKAIAEHVGDIASEPVAPVERTAPRNKVYFDDPIIKQSDVQFLLTEMAKNAGWAERGGRLLRENMDDNTSAVIGRTQWIPKEPWWTDRPHALNENQVREAVRKALADEPLTRKERDMVQYMIDYSSAERAHYEGEKQTLTPEQAIEAVKLTGGKDPFSMTMDEQGALVMELEKRGLPTDLSLYSRGKKSVGGSVEEITTAVRESFGKATAKLNDAGVIGVVKDVSELPPRADGQAHPADTKAVFDGERVYVVADNVAPNEVTGVILHEVGAHYGMEQMLGSKLYRQLLSQVDAKARAGEGVYAEAMRQVPADTPVEFQKDELLAYLIQNQPELPLVQKVLSTIKQFLYRVLGGRFIDLTPDDIRTMAVASLKRVSSAEAMKSEGSFLSQYAQALKGKTFYSALERGFETSKMETMPADQWASWINGNAGKLGIKKDELYWSGLDDYLQARGKDKVTRAELIEYVKNNGIKLDEVTKGGTLELNTKSEYALPEVMKIFEQDQGASPDALRIALENNYEAYQALTKKFPNLEDTDNWADRVVADITGGKKVNGTKYDNWQLPGGQNYREMLLTLPSREQGKYVLETKDGKVLAEFANRDEAFYHYISLSNEEKLASQIRPKTNQQEFQSSHWDEKNVLAHIRFNDRTDADGNKVLFIEEIQSDWHQKGRKEGYSGIVKATPEEMAEWRKLDRMNQANMTAEQSARLEVLDELVAGMRGVPDAPFKETKDWTALGLKRMIRYAVENDYDKVAFVNGKQSADRYDLSKQIDEVYYNKTTKSFGAYKDKRIVMLKEDVEPKDLENLIGKETAQKLLDAPIERPTARGAEHMEMQRLVGQDLKVGGEGMMKYYDQIVPNVAKDIIKKFDSKLEPMNFVGQDVKVMKRGDEYQVWADGQLKGHGKTEAEARANALTDQLGFEITDKMREQAMAGQPLYARMKQKITDSATFRKWFGESAVVDDSGKPLMVYHGTFGDFAEFKTGFKGASENETAKIGHWFTNEPRTAESFAQRPSNEYVTKTNPETGDLMRWADGEPMKYRAPDEVGAIMPTYLSIKKPLVFETKGSVDAFEAFMDFRDKFAEYINGTKGVEGAWRKRYVALNVEKTNKDLLNYLKENGHDGIILKNTDYDSPDGKPINQYLVLDSSQVKSATGNRGTFDPNNPNIMYSRGNDSMHEALDYTPKGIAERSPDLTIATEDGTATARDALAQADAEIATAQETSKGFEVAIQCALSMGAN